MFKYLTQLSVIEGDNQGACTSGLTSINITSYRWVFEDNRPANFLPRALIPNPKIVDYQKKCRGWSLSMFDSKENAEARLIQLCKDKPVMFKRIGTHIAEGELTETDGLITDVGQDGHFDFFEYENVDLQEKFTIIQNVEAEYDNQ